ncbi:hypothetical protein [Metabacillus bambusae]|uniref:Uncharacterized protein n=1 Tax=Metabacillus bambusae TaxID=2795218 RepID=A0ABS3NBX1_9BACI|nr:hypothetical protein [Metabacillus bambusae]MBO1515660.1 hypothetical protein [Metabacillus bambusae]
MMTYVIVDHESRKGRITPDLDTALRFVDLGFEIYFFFSSDLSEVKKVLNHMSEEGWV